MKISLLLLFFGYFIVFNSPTKAQSADSVDVIYEDVPDINQDDVDSTMAWIKNKVTGILLPYCWRQSYGRGAGVVRSVCDFGLEKDGQLCYTACEAGYSGAGPVCWQNCPTGSGFRDDGAYCAKPSSYGRGSGYAAWDKDLCNKEHPDVGCEQNGLMWYPKCKTNFHSVGCCVCSPDCPPGFTDIGVSCQKKSYGRGAGTVLQCPEGTIADETGGPVGLCYTACNNTDFHGIGPVCWQNCATDWVECGAGCAGKQMECVTTTVNQVLQPILLAYSVATFIFGPEVSKVPSVVAEGIEESLKEGKNAATATTKISKVGAAAKKVWEQLSKTPEGEQALTLAETKNLVAIGKNKAVFAIKDAEGVSETLKAAWTGLKDMSTPLLDSRPVVIIKRINGSAEGKLIKAGRSTIMQTYDLVKSYYNQYSDDFAEQTSHEVDSIINAHFTRPGYADYIKQYWGNIQLKEMASANGYQIADEVMSAASIAAIADPTGIVGGIIGTVQAFAHPVCGDNIPFPTFSQSYNVATQTRQNPNNLGSDK